MHVMQIPVLSTGHVSRETISALENKSIRGITCAEYPEGFFLLLAYADVRLLPDDLYALVKWSRANNHTWIRLDADGDTIEGLTQYEW